MAGRLTCAASTPAWRRGSGWRPWSSVAERVEVARFLLPIPLDESIEVMRAIDRCYAQAAIGPSEEDAEGRRWATILAEPPTDAFRPSEPDPT